MLAELHFPATSPRRISSGGFAASLLAECQGLMNTRRRIIVALWVLLNGGVNLWLACPSSHRKSAPITSNETEFEATRCQFASAEGLLGQVLGVLFVERLLCSHAAVTDLIFTLEMKEGMPFVLALQRMLRGTGGRNVILMRQIHHKIGDRWWSATATACSAIFQRELGKDRES
jgi:hypothetical protein